MIDKWADFLISKVGYDTNRTHIVKVRVHKDLGDNIGDTYDENRSTVVSNLKNDKTYCTIIKKEKWAKGASVKIFPVHGKEFIKTKKNEIESDNLGELPEF